MSSLNFVVESQYSDIPFLVGVVLSTTGFVWFYIFHLVILLICHFKPSPLQCHIVSHGFALIGNIALTLLSYVAILICEPALKYTLIISHLPK